jgi:predicted nucleotidyltransferase
MDRQVVDQLLRQHGTSIFGTFSVTDQDLAPTGVNILDAQLETFHEPKPRPVEERRDEPIRLRQLGENRKAVVTAAVDGDEHSVFHHNLHSSAPKAPIGGTLTGRRRDMMMIIVDARATLRQFYRRRAFQKREASRRRRTRYEAMLPSIVEGILERDPLVSRIILFGSLAEQEEGVVRDIDIAVESNDFLKVSGWLLSLPEPIDVVDLNTLYPHVRNRVEAFGRVLYER